MQSECQPDKSTVITRKASSAIRQARAPKQGKWPSNIEERFTYRLIKEAGLLASHEVLPPLPTSKNPAGYSSFCLIKGRSRLKVHRLGLTAALTIAVASQFIIAAPLDHFGLTGAAVRPLDLTRSLGIGILILGVWLIMR